MDYKRGISLVALVITVIVMLILAGISYNAIFGDNGVISQAMKSKENTENAAVVELMELAWSARMTRFLTEPNSAVSIAYLMQLKEDLNTNLSGNGKVISIDYDEENEKFSAIFQDTKQNNYELDIDRKGKVTVAESHIPDEKVEQKKRRYAVIEDDTGRTIENENVEEDTPFNKVDLYGQRVETGVTVINGVDLSTYNTDEDTYNGDNWKIFYIDDSKVYLIYGDYFPTVILNPDENINRSNNYNIYISSLKGLEDGRSTLKNYFNDPSNYSMISDALTGEGKTFAGKTLITRASPTLKMWFDSWNEKYSKTMGYQYLAEGEEFNYYDESNGTITTKVAGASGNVITQDVSLGGYSWALIGAERTQEEGYLEGREPTTAAGYTHNLYFPRKYYWSIGGINFIAGYWLNDVSAFNEDTLSVVYSDAKICSTESAYSQTLYTIRPIVEISISDFESATGIRAH